MRPHDVIAWAMSPESSSHNNTGAQLRYNGVLILIARFWLPYTQGQIIDIKKETL